ncbi:hypothetical protein BN946_scf184977.g107 [Trametes cinnabarina]|uniref:Asparagine synthetase domain-containing protein n=1 Tax=Pycnoporus cinnabarinus TaxID=5643 RepID=A0A060SJ02_PYCCI|nr:hypothetical protein BN946_scf184977.g107 [Trametes cinnabarina]
MRLNVPTGPDAQGTLSRDFDGVRLNIYASELRLRGDFEVKQPHTDAQGNILCWNGEVFEGLEVATRENDGMKLFDAFRRCNDSREIIRVFGEIEGPVIAPAMDGLIAQLDRSVMLRVRNIPLRNNTLPGQARVAVFFSGGIDSTMLAFLADRHVDPTEPIDLLNVAFENPRKIAVKATGNIGGLPKREKKQKLRDPLDYSTVTVSYDVPDRLTGLQEVEELKRLCPNRKWNFLEVNVPFKSQNARATVEALMFPSRTVMDLSLAIALYFAARGIGQVRSHPGAEPLPYTSPARVLLNGLGSDELLGGYGRHRTAFKAAGWQAVIEELQLEIDRIPTRNLGRDDRVISSWGKETRHPFLSLSVVNFLAQLPVHLKMDPRLESGLGRSYC